MHFKITLRPIRNEAQSNQLKFWEIIADNLSKSRLELDWVSALDSNGRTIWIVDAHRGDGQRFVVRADEELNCFCGTRIGDPLLRRVYLTDFRCTSETKC
jgi:hypothetical protein